MCGFAGYTSRNKPVTTLEIMLSSMAHRGPDDEGIYNDDRISLGHKRLSIIDIKGGHQPMLSADGRYVIAYNGEIYNYPELRKKLLSEDRRLTTNSDTEVLLYWLVHHGLSGLPDLNGMFAFAFWDRQERSLLLVRDRLGIKPLYYSIDKGELIFASEIKAMLPLLPQREADPGAIYEFLVFQNMISEKTFFKNIYKLQPGQWLRWTASEITTGSYWDISFTRDFRGTFHDAVEEYSAVLQNSVSRHMIADVPVGAYLSGGFDSSSVATLAAAGSGSAFHTFTGAFADAPYYDEREGSRTVANKIGADLHEIEITPQQYLNNIGRVVYHLDEPTLGTGAFPQYMVSGLVSKHVKVVLTGHGGDEMFAGYQVNKVALIRETLRNNPAALLSVLMGIGRDEWTRVLYYLLYPLRYPEVRHGLFIMTPRKKRASFFSHDFLSDNRGVEPLDLLEKYIGQTDDLPGEQLMRLYVKTYLPTLFMQEDRVSMAHSIEARTPLCDNEMVDIALKFPLQLKLWGNNLKAITRTAMRSRLPHVLYTLPKKGFPTPFNRWYREEPLRSFMEDLLFSSRTAERGIFNKTCLQKIFLDNLRSGGDTLYDYARANRLYSASVVELWYRTFIDKPEPGPVT